MWAIYAILSALFAATIDPVAKTALRKTDAYLVGWLGLLFSLPFLAIPYFMQKAPALSPGLFRIMMVAMPFEVLATIFYYKALKKSDISITVPFLALTPVFSALLAFVLMGERLSGPGMLGVFLITVGVYSLNIKESKNGLLHPIRAIFRNKGSIYMAFVGFLFGITSTLSKMAMLTMTPETIPFIYMSVLAICFVPVLIYRFSRGMARMETTVRAYIRYAAMGLLFALTCATYFKSVSMANLAYTISLKRMSLLMSVGYGWLIFRERDVHIRFLGTLCMCIGIALIFSAPK